MLSMLADRTHQVYTGVSIITNENGQRRTNTFFEKTDVTFYPIHREDLLRYTLPGDSLDKAGAYGIQGDFAIHVKKSTEITITSSDYRSGGYITN